MKGIQSVMARRRPAPGRCIHCLEYSDNMTWDHIFPQAWYPDSTPPEMEKWDAPSCALCNNEYSKIEERLLMALGLCLDPTEAASAGVGERARRSIDPKLGRDERDSRIRG